MTGRAAFRRLAALLVASLGLLPAARARGGGGCLAAGTLIDTPAGPVPVEQLRIGDEVTSRDAAGRPIRAVVRAVSPVDPPEFLAVEAGGRRLLATAEHPLQTAPGTWTRADRLAVHATLATAGGPAAVTRITRVPATTAAYDLLVSPGGVFVAGGIVVHNKGCFLPDTPVALAGGGERPIREVKTGDRVLAFDAADRLVPATVRSVLVHQVESYLVARTETRELRVTEEHPFYVGAGVYKAAAALRVGDSILVYNGRGLAPEKLVALERVSARVEVYNLQTDEPHTFFASGAAVHNKGGGGCFAAGTRVLTPDGARAIESFHLGDPVLAVDTNGGLRPATVRGIHLNWVPLLTVRTDRGDLRATEEHPVGLAAGGFRPAGAVHPGTRLAAWDGSALAAARVLGTAHGEAMVPVYTLSVDGPHTFVADGFLVHNKGGGGGFHGGYGHGGSGGNADPPTVLLAFGVIAAIMVISHLCKGSEKGGDDGEDLDFCFSRGQIRAKAEKTKKLLAFISRVDEAWSASRLEAHAEGVFRKLQECWAARAYEPMNPLLMPDLYAEHVAQVEGMRQTHEINRIDRLHVEAVDIVQVNYTDKPDHRAYTALITASAQDYYIDDRDQSFLRGDEAPATFQEFWTFQLYGGAWRLREIEQTRESDVLSEENVFEQFTNVGLDQVYGETAGAAGPVGPGRGAAVEAKAGRIERLLNFLVQTDRIWDREAMLGTVRRVYLSVLLAWQDGRPEAFAGLDVDADLAAHLRGVNAANRASDRRVEYRNLCVRKVEIVHINNRDDNRLDEFTALVRAHAQIIISHRDQVEYRDPDVRPIDDFWTFGRDGSRWALRAILPRADGAALLRKENVDEGSSPEMLEWFYSKPRA